MKSFKLFVIRKAIKWLREIDDADLKRSLLTESVKKLYNSIGSDDILRLNSDGSWSYKNRTLTQAEISVLRQEAQLLKTMKLWNVIQSDVRFHLGKKMFEEARVKDDIVWGQLITYLNDVIHSRIEKM